MGAFRPNGISWNNARRGRFIEHTRTRRKFEVAAIKKAKSSQESDAKAALWTALANSINSQTSSLQANIAGTQEKSENTLAERAKLFGEIVADNLLQCDPKDWTMLKKKIFDLFYDYEQGILNGAQQLPTY